MTYTVEELIERPEIKRYEGDVQMFEYKLPKNKKLKASVGRVLRRGYYRNLIKETEDGYLVTTNCLPDAFQCVVDRAKLDIYGMENHCIADRVGSSYFLPYREHFGVTSIDLEKAMNEGRA